MKLDQFPYLVYSRAQWEKVPPRREKKKSNQLPCLSVSPSWSESEAPACGFMGPRGEGEHGSSFFVIKEEKWLIVVMMDVIFTLHQLVNSPNLMLVPDPTSTAILG